MTSFTEAGFRTVIKEKENTQKMSEIKTPTLYVSVFHTAADVRKGSLDSEDNKTTLRHSNV